jgi:hypothetical protein
MKPLFSGLVLTLIISLQLQAQVNLGGNSTVAFATPEEAKAILTDRDDFAQRMSPFDRSARLKTSKEVSEQEYLKFVGQSVLEWNESEKQRITSALEAMQAELESLSLQFPKKVFMVKTTGNEEGGSPYTRANAVILPKTFLGSSMPELKKMIAHELFHILSRSNPELREKLYKVIGFEKCNEIPFPKELQPRKITNPDAPFNDHYIKLQVGDKECLGVPILYSRTEKYDEEQGGDFLNYIQLQFVEVERAENGATVKVVYEGKKAKFVHPRMASGLFEKVGRNTDYIIHPEEILADNFALLVLQEQDVPSPAILKNLELVLKGKNASSSAAKKAAN